MQKIKKNYDREEFIKIVKQYKEEEEKLAKLTEEEKQEYEEERFKIKEQLRNENIQSFPIMIKSSTAGSLETLLKEAKKLLKGMYRIDIIATGVGPVSESDVNMAAQTGAIILTFDVGCQPHVAKSLNEAGVCVR